MIPLSSGRRRTGASGPMPGFITSSRSPFRVSSRLRDALPWCRSSSAKNSATSSPSPSPFITPKPSMAANIRTPMSCSVRDAWTTASNADRTSSSSRPTPGSRNAAGRKKDASLYQKARLRDLRASWAAIANRALEREGHAARIDHRSFKDRGIDHTPEPRLGPRRTQTIKAGRDEEARRALSDMRQGRVQLDSVRQRIRTEERVIEAYTQSPDKGGLRRAGCDSKGGAATGGRRSKAARSRRAIGQCSSRASAMKMVSVGWGARRVILTDRTLSPVTWTANAIGAVSLAGRNECRRSEHGWPGSGV